MAFGIAVCSAHVHRVLRARALPNTVMQDRSTNDEPVETSHREHVGAWGRDQPETPATRSGRWPRALYLSSVYVSAISHHSAHVQLAKKAQGQCAFWTFMGAHEHRIYPESTQIWREGMLRCNWVYDTRGRSKFSLSDLEHDHHKSGRRALVSALSTARYLT